MYSNQRRNRITVNTSALHFQAGSIQFNIFGILDSKNYLSHHICIYSTFTNAENTIFETFQGFFDGDAVVYKEKHSFKPLTVLPSVFCLHTSKLNCFAGNGMGNKEESQNKGLRNDTFILTCPQVSIFVQVLINEVNLGRKITKLTEVRLAT